jgi:hypothetical protein
MAPPSADWQNLLRIKPTTIELENEAEEEQNEGFGELYTTVKDEYSIGKNFIKTFFSLVQMDLMK